MNVIQWVIDFRRQRRAEQWTRERELAVLELKELARAAGFIVRDDPKREHDLCLVNLRAERVYEGRCWAVDQDVTFPAAHGFYSKGRLDDLVGLLKSRAEWEFQQFREQMP